MFKSFFLSASIAFLVCIGGSWTSPQGNAPCNGQTCTASVTYPTGNPVQSGGACGTLAIQITPTGSTNGTCWPSGGLCTGTCTWSYNVDYFASSGCNCNNFTLNDCGTPVTPSPACQPMCGSCTIYATTIGLNCGAPSCNSTYTILDANNPSHFATVQGRYSCSNACP
jgi:hypothetical protein